MKVNSKEFNEILINFENNFKGIRLDREERVDFHRKIYYQNGDTNNLFKAYLNGYSYAKSLAISGDLILEN